MVQEELRYSGADAVQLLGLFGACYGVTVVRGSPNPKHYGLSLRLRRARRQAGLTRAGLARAAGISDAIVRYIETDSRVPLVNTVERLADALGVSPCWLAFGVETPMGNTPSPSGLPERLRDAREARGLSARALGRASDTSDTTVRLTETGETIPNLAKLEALADALSVSPCWLAFGLGARDLVPRRRTRTTTSLEGPGPL